MPLFHSHPQREPGREEGREGRRVHSPELHLYGIIAFGSWQNLSVIERERCQYAALGGQR